MGYVYKLGSMVRTFEMWFESLFKQEREVVDALVFPKCLVPKLEYLMVEMEVGMSLSSICD